MIRTICFAVNVGLIARNEPVVEIDVGVDTLLVEKALVLVVHVVVFILTVQHPN